MEAQKLSTSYTEGMEVTSFAVDHVSTSHNHIDRRIDDLFTVRLLLCYQNNGNPNERSSSFTLNRENYDVELLGKLGRELRAINATSIPSFICVVDVIVNSCQIFRREVFDLGRKSLAMIVKIKLLYDEFLVEDNVEDDYELEEEEEEEDEEDEGEEMSSVEVKKNLLINGGVKFISGDQISTDIECSICLKEFDRNSDRKHIRDVSVLPCSHIFHEGCLVPWIAKGKNTCPMCRFNLFSN